MIYLLVPVHEEAGPDYLWALLSGYFTDPTEAQEAADRMVAEHIAEAHERFKQDEDQRAVDYARKVRNRSQAIREHRVLAEAGLRAPDQEPAPHGPFVPRQFDEAAVPMPRYKIEEVLPH